MSAALLDGLVDDAGLFPPEELAMGPALRRHAADLASANPQLSQRFLCPASRVAEALGLLDGDQQITVSVVADTGVAGLPAALDPLVGDDRVTVAAVECRVDPPDWPGDVQALRAAVPASAVVWVESAWDEGLIGRLETLARGGWGGAKLRCGGVRQELFPCSASLAHAVAACARLGLPWKATAGLHRAVRYTDSVTGLRHHGYLNLLLAAARAAAGADEAALVEVLDADDPGALVAEALALPPDVVTAARSAFVSYGSCSTAEPIEEATSLGLTPPVAVGRA